MDFGHFHIVILDVEGRVLKSNKSFEKISPSPLGKEFWKSLSLETAEEFCYSFELMLSSPKIRRHLLLEHPGWDENRFSQIWWEFSVITTPEMDISAVIGIGIGVHLLEQEMPWTNLVDVLGFGKISLDRNFRIIDWDDRIENWFGENVQEWKKKALTQTKDFGEETVIFEGLHAVLDNPKPFCFLLKNKGENKSDFAALLASGNNGYQFFLVPKENSKSKSQEAKVFSDRDINLIKGPMFVLNHEGILVQQNLEAKKFGADCLGRANTIGYHLNFSAAPEKFLKFFSAIDSAKKGISSQFEQSIFISKDEIRFWEVSIRPVQNFKGEMKGIIIHLLETTSYKKQIFELYQENDKLKEMAIQPSHILRGPLSSMLGILELIDPKDLSEENKKLFGYLKPLAMEMDDKIREYAKTISSWK
ncbi:hypothetical protein DFQ04_0253 [Algoriphagus boseongensis]|uniref:PAS domain-containing protein n=2 Tax=Algoriphagus boseongensis TaxID=1442587 RepID=A0A4R6T738_9BACT|nr:hypothetical protein DFQ04_0253 [Algoriphagus boseongensis]